jgi:hypothetical protein
MSTPFRLATFRANVTPPIGSPLCGGLIRSAVGVTDPLRALGVILLPQEELPIVLCAVDWCEICNEDHVHWRERLAAAAGTTPERVAVHCVHQHDTPLTDRNAQQIHRGYDVLPDLMDVQAFHQAVGNVAEAIQTALPNAAPVTHVRTGQADVEQVASNRRVPAPDGTIQIRWSRCPDPALRAEPEGLIDPALKTVSFWNEDRKLAALHYYAVHPMSYYGGGEVSADFVGLARERRQQEEPDTLHVYFTGCAGNLTAGKYNDGSPENRTVLAERLYSAMVASEQEGEEFVPQVLKWSVELVQFVPRANRSEADLLAIVANPVHTKTERTLAALEISFLRRTAAKIPVPITSLHLDDQLCLLHLPGEAFVEYQLYAQSLRPEAFVAVASYGDLGMSYIPLEHHFQEVGGYEETWAFGAPETETLLKESIHKVTLESEREARDAESRQDTGEESAPERRQA